MKKLLLSCAMVGLLSACTSNGPLFHSWEEYETERAEGAVYKVEEPYEVKGIWYFPAEQNNYSEKGLASWYMPAGDSALTANGEVYDANLLTARHKTLPLPSLVKITNLENGKEIVARVNDRGPMVNNRLMDVSQEAA
ncbi:MAG: septal ring lytic transglycosylase RlpA family protein, partial [Alphaproteobacteria bacterium]